MKSLSRANRGIRFLFTLSAFLLALVCAAGPARASGAAANLFNEANKSYAEGRYGEAAMAYEKLVEQGIENPDLFYNLGTARLRQGRLAEAVMWLERARRLDPRDPDILHNLKVAQARSRGEVKGPERGPFVERLEKLYRSYTLRELAWAASLVWLLFAVTLVGRLLVRRARLRTAFGWASALLGFALLGLVIFTADRRSHDDRPMAVVKSEEVGVHGGPSEGEPQVTLLYEGIVVQVFGERGQWTEVGIPGLFKGWVKSNSLLDI